MLRLAPKWDRIDQLFGSLKSVTLSNAIQALVGVLFRRGIFLAANSVDQSVYRLIQNGRLPFKVCHSPLPPCFAITFAQRLFRKPPLS